MCYVFSAGRLEPAPLYGDNGGCGPERLNLLAFLPGLQQQGIFRVPGSQVEVNDIKNSFERGESDATAVLLLSRSQVFVTTMVHSGCSQAKIL